MSFWLNPDSPKARDKTVPCRGALFLGLCTLIVCTCCGVSGVWAEPPEILTLNPARSMYRLARYLEILEDPHKEWSIHDVTSPELTDRFRPAGTRVLNLGLTSSAYWLRFTVQKDPDERESRSLRSTWVLQFWRTFLTSVEFYTPRAAPASGWRLSRAHFLTPSGQNDSSTRLPVLRLPSDLDAPKTLYLRVESNTALILAFTISTEEAYVRQTRGYVLLFGLYYGILAAMVAFNLFVYFYLGDRNHLWFVLHKGFLTLYFLGISGHTLDYVLSDYPILDGRLTLTFLGIGLIWSAVFARSFLAIGRNSPMADDLMKGLMAVAGLFVLTMPFAGLRAMVWLYSTLGLIAPFLLMVAGFIRWRQGFKPARFFLLATALAAVGGLTMVLTFRGLLPFTVIGFYGFQLGSALDALVLSFALVDRIRTLQWYRSITEISPDMILIHRNNTVLFANQAAAAMAGVETPEALVGRSMPELAPLDPETLDERNPAQPTDGFKGERRVRRDDGTVAIGESRTVPILYGGEMALLSVIRDITQRKELERELHRLAITDPLTNAFNRRHFIERGDVELRRTRRYDRPMSVLMLDIDHFKRVNDQYGHKVGDRALVTVTEACSHVLRGIDILGRYGGEEFAVLLPETGESAALEVAERLRKTVAALAIDAGGQILRFTVSIGVAPRRTGEDDIDTLLNRADAALYEAKRQGRDRVVLG